MYWKVPAEHTVNNKQMAAELQIFHIQYATNRQVAFSILFEEPVAQADAQKLKTCFFKSFDFAGAAQRQKQGLKNPIIDVPLEEFIKFLPQDKYIYYYGSETLP